MILGLGGCGEAEARSTGFVRVLQGERARASTVTAAGVGRGTWRRSEDAPARTGQLLGHIAMLPVADGNQGHPAFLRGREELQNTGPGRGKAACVCACEGCQP